MTAGVQLNAIDPRSLADLRQLARTEGQSDAALRGAAKQFEALFLSMMLKSMRQANPSNGPMDNDQTRLYQELLDQQLASNIAQGKGAGLADALFRQLGGGKTEANDALAAAGGFPLSDAARWNGSAADALLQRDNDKDKGKGSDALATGGLNRRQIGALLALGSDGAGQGDAARVSDALADGSALSAKLAAAIDAARDAGNAVAQRAREFVAEIWPHAVEAAKATGIPARFMVAQAALETGWGAKQQKNADGSPTHNLFNIKAGKAWAGDTAASTVSEYEDGQWKQEDARFRSYASYAEAFADYARLMTRNPRYAAVPGTRDAAGFAQKLQNAGYATDPQYAQKLTRVIGGDTLRHALLAAR
ncbi:flagellar rod assembly protein/muramidase FlgJ [Betaproteobacteria bacterium]|nr:flagellar rod assembly protein/muramidase FlgJ [Betaproteobacteria bacterium]